MPRSIPSVATEWRTAESYWDWFFLAAITALLVFLPFSLGVVEAWSEFIVVAAAALLAVGLLLRIWLDADFKVAATRSYLPLLAVLALIGFQLLPLPTGFVSLLSPRSVELRQELLDEVAPAAEDRTTLSLYTLETAHDLRMALVFTVLFVTAASVFRSSAQIKRVLLIIFLVGSAEACLALLQILTLSTKIHWVLVEMGKVVTSGSFINHSHFCQFVNLAMGAGIAILLIRLREDGRRERGRASRLVDLRGERYLRPLTGIVLCAVAVFTSMSRNGVISLLLAAGIIGVLLYRRGLLSVRGWLMGMVPWCVALVLFVTCFDTVYDRLATLEDRQYFDVRLEMTAGVLRAWRDFPLWGSGLGTHEYVFPLYDTSVSTSLAEHADNDWAQLLEEFGLIGAGAVLTYVVSVFWIASRLMISGKSTVSTAAFGLCLGLLATAWHSLSDFGQHLPGVFSLTAIVSGLIVAIARHEARKTGSRVSAQSTVFLEWMPRKLRLVLATICVLVACGWAVIGALAAHRAEAWSNVALGVEQRLERQDWQGGDQEFVDLITATQYAAQAEPKNVKVGHQLNLARWRSISRTRDPETNQILLAPNTIPFVERIVQGISQLRSICPVYGPLHGLEGELRLLVLGDPEGARLIYQAAKLVPFDAATNLLAGQVAAREGKLAEANAYLHRAVDLDPRQFVRVVPVYLATLGRSDLAVDLAGDNYQRMVRLAQLLEATESSSADDASSEHLELAAQLRTRAIARLRELVAIREANAGEMAQLAAMEMENGQPAAAIELYRRALSQQYGEVGWRLSLARALIASGRPQEALREVKIVLRLRPESQGANELMREIGDLPSKNSRTDPVDGV